jgi:hypothetical protein
MDNVQKINNCINVTWLSCRGFEGIIWRFQGIKRFLLDRNCCKIYSHIHWFILAIHNSCMSGLGSYQYTNVDWIVMSQVSGVRDLGKEVIYKEVAMKLFCLCWEPMSNYSFSFFYFNFYFVFHTWPIHTLQLYQNKHRANFLTRSSNFNPLTAKLRHETKAENIEADCSKLSCTEKPATLSSSDLHTTTDMHHVKACSFI